MDGVSTPLFKPRFRFALVLLTNRCNLACKHCYVESGPKGHQGLDKKRVLGLVDELHDLYGEMFFSLSGGEALVRMQDCLEVLRYATTRHSVQLVSNGTLIDRAAANELAKLDISIKVSLDGSGPKTHDWMRGEGTFAATMQGIGNLFNAGFPASRLALGATIPHGKVSEINGILDVARSCGITKIRFDSVAKIGRARYFWPHESAAGPDPDSCGIREYFAGEFQRRHAHEWRLVDLNESIGMFETLHVYFDGEVHVYLNYDYPIATEGRIGNVYENTLKEIVDGPKIRDAIIRKFLRFARMPERSFISYYVIRGAASSNQLWFEDASTAA